MSEAARVKAPELQPRPGAPISQFGLLGTKRLGPLFITQFLGAFNDNLFKQAFIVILTFGTLIASGSSGIYVNLAAGLFILPFFLFSATAGTLADTYEKSKLIRIVKLGEVAVAATAAIALYLESATALFAALFLFGVQSTFFGPLKYSVLPQHLNTSELVGGNAVVQMGTFVAILLGTIAGGVIGGSNGGGLYLALMLVAVSLGGYAACRQIPVATPAPGSRRGWNPLKETWRLLVLANERKAVFLSVLGVSWFWLLGSVVLAQIPELVRSLAGGPHVVALIMTVFTIAIAAGSLLCEKLSGRRVEIGLVPLGAAGISIFALDSSFAIGAVTGTDTQRTLLEFLAADGVSRLLFDLAMIGVFAGLYVVPLQANIQSRTPTDRRARVIAANNVLNALFMIVGAGFAIAWLLPGGSIAGLIMVLAIINAGIAAFIFRQVPEFSMRFLVWLVSHGLYRVRHVGLEAIPDKGAAVLVCNHVSYMDACLLAGAVRRPIRFVMHDSIYRIPVLNFIFRTGQAIPIVARKDDPEVHDSAFRAIREGLAGGNLLCIFPEGRLTSDGEVGQFRRGVERMIEETPVPVIPLALRGMWGSFFSRAGNGPFIGWRGRLWRRVDVVAGEPLLPAAVKAGRLRERVLTLRGGRR